MQRSPRGPQRKCSQRERGGTEIHCALFRFRHEQVRWISIFCTYDSIFSHSPFFFRWFPFQSTSAASGCSRAAECNASRSVMARRRRFPPLPPLPPVVPYGAVRKWFVFPLPPFLALQRWSATGRPPCFKASCVPFFPFDVRVSAKYLISNSFLETELKRQNYIIVF